MQFALPPSVSFSPCRKPLSHVRASPFKSLRIPFFSPNKKRSHKLRFCLVRTKGLAPLRRAPVHSPQGCAVCSPAFRFLFPLPQTALSRSRLPLQVPSYSLFLTKQKTEQKAPFFCLVRTKGLAPLRRAPVHSPQGCAVCSPAFRFLFPLPQTALSRSRLPLQVPSYSLFLTKQKTEQKAPFFCLVRTKGLEPPWSPTGT